MQRYGDAQRTGQIASPHAAAQHHVIGGDLALVGDAAGRGAILCQQLGDLDAFRDGCTVRACALSQRLRGIGRIGRPVPRHEVRRDQIVGAQHRCLVRDFVQWDAVDLHTEGGGHGRLSLQLLLARRRAGQRDAAGLPKSGRLAGFRFQIAVQVQRVFRQVGLALRRAQLCHQARGMPSRAAGDLALLQQHGVRPAEFGEMIGDTAPDDAAANDDGAGVFRKSFGHGNLLSNRSFLETVIAGVHPG